MNIYTAHTKPYVPPVLLREGFTRLGVIFGPLWLLAHGAWVAGALAICAEALLLALAPDLAGLALAAALHWLIGLFGFDLRRWTLEQRGYAEVNVVAAENEDAALAKLLDRRPDLTHAALLADMVR